MKVYLDYEFNRIVESSVHLVCAATLDDEGRKMVWWLHKNKKRQAELSSYLKKADILIGYSCVAEARSLLALGLDPLEWNWIDLFLEYRMMTNHNDDLQWGEQLIDGKVRKFSKPKPKWERTEEDKEAGFKATHSLAEATYKLTGKIRDTEHKTAMRDLIISDPKSFTREQAKAIMAYCLEDVVFLPKIQSQLESEYKKLVIQADMEAYQREAFTRGRYSAHTAIMESTGYPIDLQATKNFSKSIGHILSECQSDINDQFPKIKPFKWAKRTNKFVWNQKATKQWVEENHDARRWLKTKGKAISLSLEAFERFYPFKHAYPRGNFGAQMVRFAKLKQSLYGFSESGGGRKSFWDSVGSDGRVRPYMNIYGAQSSRSQPGASGFMFLKPAWMRSLVLPSPGSYIASIDYGQQEFFLSGLESGDPMMIQAYLSGDPYMFGAKLAGVIPKDGKREDYKIIRDIFKNTYLGILFGMTKYGLAFKLTGDTGETWTEEMAQEQIDLFEEAFPQYMDWKTELIELYQDSGGICLPDGWRMFGDNDNPRSVMNVPIQGFGAAIMRKAVNLAVGRGVKIIFTLHDALYLESKVGYEEDILILRDAMKEAFQFFFKGTKYFDIAGNIKLDPFAWSPDYEKDSKLVLNNWEVPCSNLYVDERAGDEFDKFSKYFSTSDADLL